MTLLKVEEVMEQTQHTGSEQSKQQNDQVKQQN